MAQAKDGTSLQHQCTSSECLSGIMQHVQLGLVGQAGLVARRGRVGGDILDGEGDLGDVVLDEQLGAGVGAVEQARRRDVAQVAHQAGAQQVHQAQDVIVLAHLDDGLQPLVDEAVVVVFAGRVLAPKGFPSNKLLFFAAFLNNASTRFRDDCVKEIGSEQGSREERTGSKGVDLP